MSGNTLYTTGPRLYMSYIDNLTCHQEFRAILVCYTERSVKKVIPGESRSWESPKEADIVKRYLCECQ